MHLALASPCHAQPARALRQLLDEDRLHVHFQPIASLSDGHVHGHEALVRTPADCPWHDPDTLFEAARQEDLEIELELECLRKSLTAWAAQSPSGRLFLNLSASALVQSTHRNGLDRIGRLVRASGLGWSSVVIELTEHERVSDVDAVQHALADLRRAGVALALDDFGDGRSSLRLWSELRPEYVKIDKYFTRQVNSVSHKLQTYRALMQIAEIFGSRLIAEGVESTEELQILRDIGVSFAQGYFVGRPAAQTLPALGLEAQTALHRQEISVLPQERRASNRGLTARSLLVAAPAIPPTLCHDEVVRLFRQHDHLHALALVDNQRPVGLVNRKSFHDLYMKPYFKELMGRRPCSLHANHKPVLVEIDTHIENLTDILTSSDQRYLAEGFIITENGQYRGLGTGERLVRVVTEARIEAARHANPLTFLPGNIPITIHIERLLEAGLDFVACYADLNQFKSFNDHYGYWRGDEMIRLEAQVIVAACDPRRDFVGHVGGDDFVMLLQSDDWEARCTRAVRQFNERALLLFDDEARRAGGIEAEDRHGVTRFHGCTTLSIGVIQVAPGLFHSAEAVASAAAAAKHQAKCQHLDVFLMDAGEAQRRVQPVVLAG